MNLENPNYIKYHDEEWGVPVHDDRRHFEFLVLEGAQAGLSWEIVLNKREGYRKAFANFDPEIVAQFTDRMIERMLKNPNIIRNRLKVKSAVSNARLFLDVQNEFGSFDRYIWKYVENVAKHPRPATLKDYRTHSPESDLLAKDLKKRGFKFAGTTVMYSHMQACGLYEEHIKSCFRALTHRATSSR